MYTYWYTVAVLQWYTVTLLQWYTIVLDKLKSRSTSGMIYVTRYGKTGLIPTTTDIHFLPVRESCTHALPRNTKYLITDGQV